MQEAMSEVERHKIQHETGGNENEHRSEKEVSQGCGNTTV